MLKWHHIVGMSHYKPFQGRGSFGLFIPSLFETVGRPIVSLLVSESIQMSAMGEGLGDSLL